MLALRYAARKTWINFACAIVGGLVAVVVIGSLWDNAALMGGIAALVVVAIMLLPGVIKRAGRQEPMITIDDKGISVHPIGIGTIPWSQVLSAKLAGIPWVIGQRLVVEYKGVLPKVGFMDKLNWGINVRKRAEGAKLLVGFIDMTDQPKRAIETALSRASAQVA